MMLQHVKDGCAGRLLTRVAMEYIQVLDPVLLAMNEAVVKGG